MPSVNNRIKSVGYQNIFLPIGLYEWYKAVIFNGNKKRDDTRLLSEFEVIEFRETRKLMFIPLNFFGTLYDNLFGTRVSDNKLKTLRARKDDKYGHSPYYMADALSRINLAKRFRRRGEKNRIRRKTTDNST